VLLQNNEEIPSAGVPQMLKEAPTKRAGVLKVALCQNERGVRSRFNSALALKMFFLKIYQVSSILPALYGVRMIPTMPAVYQPGKWSLN
jgi:hypothetical protein